ncbi:MAG: CDP-diacylglycerol--serine O-phosphatidyltransferase [Ignavibacteria bacterium]|nr:CDP-diacylglycerol--serine O-phosphatidyltransferase [Ignavibacteria bacterium]
MLSAKKFIPSLFTILNAFCGFLSIIESSNSNFNSASLFIIYASIFDMLDGIVARILKTSSDFGVELDSLSDSISFGAAPSFLLYSIYFNELNSLGLFLASLTMIFAVIRLARFNVELVGYEKDKFYGLPTPVAAITICTYIILYHNKLFDIRTSGIIITIISVILPLLMVSKLQYPVLPKLSVQSLKKNKIVFSIIVIFIIISVLTNGYAVFPICVFYILSGIFFDLYRIVFKPRKPIHKRVSQRNP